MKMILDNRCPYCHIATMRQDKTLPKGWLRCPLYNATASERELRKGRKGKKA